MTEEKDVDHLVDAALAWDEAPGDAELCIALSEACSSIRLSLQRAKRLCDCGHAWDQHIVGSSKSQCRVIDRVAPYKHCACRRFEGLVEQM